MVIMMRKIGFLIVLLLALPFVFAQSATNSTDVRAEAALAAASEHGATIRLLQLGKALDRAINHAETVIEYAENASKNTSELLDIFADMKSLQEKVNVADPSSETVVREFVSLRQEANNLTQTFRRIAHNLLSEEELFKLREGFKNNEYTDNRTEIIRQRICQHNAEQIGFLLNKFNQSAPELVRDVAACTKSVRQARAELRRVYQSIGQERRQEAQNQIAENQARVRVREISEYEAAENYSRELAQKKIERAKEIRENRSQNMQQRMNSSEQRIMPNGAGRKMR